MRMSGQSLPLRTLCRGSGRVGNQFASKLVTSGKWDYYADLEKVLSGIGISNDACNDCMSKW